MYIYIYVCMCVHTYVYSSCVICRFILTFLVQFPVIADADCVVHSGPTGVSMHCLAVGGGGAVEERMYVRTWAAVDSLSLLFGLPL